MKKFFSILIVFAILFSTVGVTVATHYCKMKESCIEKKQCCKKACTQNCCDTEVKVYKLSFDSLPTSFTKFLKALFTNIISPVFNALLSIKPVESKIFVLIKPPLLIRTIEASFIEVFRI